MWSVLLQGLGLEYAKQLVKQGCRTLVLTSRTGALADEDKQHFSAYGAAVHVLKTDAGVASEMQQMLAWVHDNLPPVQQYVHAAGVSGFDMLNSMSSEALLEVCKPKVSQR